MDFIIGSLVLAVALIVLGVVHVHRVASWRALLMIAVATGSLKACVDFLRYCEHQQPRV